MSRKIVFCLIAMFFSLSCSAQFVLTPNGFVSSTDTSKIFTVAPFDSLSQKALFNKTMMYLNTIYVSPKDVISSVDSSSITINGIKNNCIFRNDLHVFDMNYTINIQFKNGRIRVNRPYFTLTNSTGTNFQTMYIKANTTLNASTMGIWNEKGELKAKRVKKELEDYFNSFLDKLIKGISIKNDW